MKPMIPNDLGGKLIVEDCQRLTVKDYLQKFRLKLKEEVLGSVVEIAQQAVELETTRTGFNGVRYWFRCPLCQRRAGVLFIHPFSRKVGCRFCLDLDYRSRRYRGMIEGK